MEHVFENSRAKIGALKTELVRVDFYKRLHEICSIINCFEVKVFWVDALQTGFTFTQSEPNRFNNCFRVFDKEIASIVAMMKYPILVDSMTKYNAHNPGVILDLKAGITSTLAYPLLDSKRRTMAVIQFNKNDGSKFAGKDVEYIEELIKWLSYYVEQLLSTHKDKIGYDLSQFLSSKLLDYFNKSLTFGQMIGNVAICLRHFLENDLAFFYELAIGSANKICNGFYVECPRNNQDPITFKKVEEFLHIKDDSLLADVVETCDFMEYFTTADQEDFREKLDRTIFDYCEDIDINSCTFLPVCYAGTLFGIITLINPVKLKNIFELEMIASYMGQAMYYRHLQYCLEYEQNRCSVIKDCLHNVITIKKYHSNFNWNVEIEGDFDSINWRIKPGDDNLMAYSYYMFMRLFDDKLEEESVKKFISSCLQTHRDKPYHNFKLSFRIARTIYCILLKIRNNLTTNEKLGLMVSSLLIYCDYNGLNNDIFIRTNHPIAKIFPKYHKKEKKRIWIGKLILENSKILKLFSKEDARKIIDCFSEIMFSNSNWSSKLYFEKLNTTLRDPNFEFNINQKKNRKFVLNLIFRCGLQTRHVQDFNMVKELCESLFKEYFDIGDMELIAGFEPIPRMNKSNFHKIPQYELEYINDHVIPMFELLAYLFPDTKEFLDCVTDVAKAYEIVLDKEGKNLWSQDKSLGKSFSDRLIIL